MKFKVCFICIVVLSLSSAADAYVYSFEKVPSGKITRPVQKQTSSIVRRSVSNDDDIADYNAVITELQNRVNENPNDYTLYPPLIEAYLKTNKYENAYEDLIFLYSLKNSNKLSASILQDIEKLRLKITERSKYSRSKSQLFVDLAVLNLICGNSAEAEKSIKKASFQTTNPKIYIDALKHIVDSTRNYENGLSYTNLYMMNNPISDDIKNEIIKLRVYFYTNLGQHENALNEQISLIQGKTLDNDTIYETYKLLLRTNASDDKILKTLFNENIKNEPKTIYAKPLGDGNLKTTTEASEAIYIISVNKDNTGKFSLYENESQKKRAIKNKDNMLDLFCNAKGSSIGAETIKIINEGKVKLLGNNIWEVTQKADIEFVK